MNKKELEAYLLQSLNMALQINGETSYTNSFDVQVKDEGFFFIPRLPASYIDSIIFSVGAEITSTIFIYKKPLISSIIKLHTKI